MYPEFRGFVGTDGLFYGNVYVGTHWLFGPVAFRVF